MPDFIANVKRWRERAKIDFFAEFVKHGFHLMRGIIKATQELIVIEKS